VSLEQSSKLCLKTYNKINAKYFMASLVVRKPSQDALVTEAYFQSTPTLCQHLTASLVVRKSLSGCRFSSPNNVAFATLVQQVVMQSSELPKSVVQVR